MKRLTFSILLAVGIVGNMALADSYTDPSCSGLTLNVFPVDAQGWTILPALNQPGRRVIYVSSKNTPHNDGTNYWVQTSEQGLALLRVGSPDSLLYNRGETFHLSSSISSIGLDGGSSPALAKVIGAYGAGARPIIQWNQAHSLIAVEGYPVENLIITQLDIQPDPSLAKAGVGITIAPGGKASDNVNLLIEDVRIGGARTGFGFISNMTIENMTNVTVRRSEILDACGAFRSQGAYFDNVIGEKIEENFMDSNGLGTCGVLTSGSGQAQNIYSTVRTKCVRAFGNVISNAHGNGFEMRYGGVFENNFMYRNNTDLNWGVTKGGSVEGKSLPLGVSGHIDGNVFTSAINFGNSNAVLVQNNIFDTPVVGAQLVIDTTSGVGVHGAKIDGNIFWGGKYPVSIEGPAAFGPLTAYNDGTKNKIVLYSQPWTSDYKNAQGVLVFQYLDMFKKVWSNGSFTMYPEGYEVNGCDLFDPSGVKVLSSAGNGILCPPPNPHLSFAGNDSFTNNLVQNVWRPIEFGQVSQNVTSLPIAQAFFKNFPMSGNTYACQSTDPKCTAAPTSWDPTAKLAVVNFVNPAVNVPANYLTLIRAQSHDNWNKALMAVSVNATFKSGFTKK